MKNSIIRRNVFIAISFLFLNINWVRAAEYRVTPSIRLGQGWDSNIFATSDNVVSDFYSTVTPELTLATVTQNLSMQIRAGFEGRWYYDHPEISTAGYSKYIRLTPIDNGWTPTARFSVSPAAYYLETRDMTARSFLIPVDPTLPPQAIATYGLQKSRDYGASIGLRYQAAARVETALTLYGATHEFPDQPSAEADSRTLGTEVSIRYALNQRSSAGLYGSGSREYFETTPDARRYAAGLLLGHQFSQAFRIDGRLGMSFIQQSASSADTSDINSNDPEGNITIVYSHNTFRADFYGILGYSGLSGVVTRTGTAGINLADQFAPQWSWSLGGNYQINRTVFAAAPREDKTLNGIGSIRYAPWDWGAFDITGNASLQQTDIPNGDITRNSVILGFTLTDTHIAF